MNKIAQVKAWKTEDGRLHLNEADAVLHQTNSRLQEKWPNNTLFGEIDTKELAEIMRDYVLWLEKQPKPATEGFDCP